MIERSCFNCHRPIFSPSVDVTETDLVEIKRGWHVPVQCLGCREEAWENLFLSISPGYDRTQLNDFPREYRILFPDWEIQFLKPWVHDEQGGRWGGKAWVNGNLVANTLPS